VRFDGDATLPLQIHCIEQLVLLVTLSDGFGELHQPIGQGSLTVVDVGDDRKIASEFGRHAKEQSEIINDKLSSL
jgi:hypothetical protein